jgi:hypothetical protein
MYLHRTMNQKVSSLTILLLLTQLVFLLDIFPFIYLFTFSIILSHKPLFKTMHVSMALTIPMVEYVRGNNTQTDFSACKWIKTVKWEKLAAQSMVFIRYLRAPETVRGCFHRRNESWLALRDCWETPRGHALLGPGNKTGKGVDNRNFQQTTSFSWLEKRIHWGTELNHKASNSHGKGIWILSYMWLEKTETFYARNNIITFNFYKSYTYDNMKMNGGSLYTIHKDGR